MNVYKRQRCGILRSCIVSLLTEKVVDDILTFNTLTSVEVVQRCQRRGSTCSVYNCYAWKPYLALSVPGTTCRM